MLFIGVVFVAFAVIALDVYSKNKQITTLSAIYFGLILGLLFGDLFSRAIDPFVNTDATKWLLGPLRILIILLFCYICVSTLFQTKDDFRFIIPYVEFSKQIKGGKPLVLDTSVIIDGRIADICDTKIIDTKLIVPRFVLHELQNVADSGDKLRRNRGRRGMDMLKRMQSNPKVDLQIHEGNIPELQDVHEVDQRLVILAKAMSARVVTNDYNLNKVAQLQGVEVINVNELANALKSVALPGEVLKVKLIKPGDQIGQGVGYLDDGTMVVVEQGRALIGQDVNATVTSVLQTSAGRMIFGRADGKSGLSSTSHQPLNQE
ncbi:MAG: PIN domain-containing protein [Gemmatales bacterium]